MLASSISTRARRGRSRGRRPAGGCGAGARPRLQRASAAVDARRRRCWCVIGSAGTGQSAGFPRPPGSAGTRTFEKNTSLTSCSPSSVMMGRTSTPGLRMSISRKLMPFLARRPSCEVRTVIEDELLRAAPAGAAVLHRPMAGQPAAPVQHGVPASHVLARQRPAAQHLVGQRGRQLRGQEGPHLVAERGFFGSEFQIHISHPWRCAPISSQENRCPRPGPHGAGFAGP